MKTTLEVAKMMTWDFATIFEANARAHPEATALMHDGRAISWSEFDARAARLATAMRTAGLSPGDVVAQYLPNRPEYLESFLAASKAGLVPMNTNYRYVDDELLEVWLDADVRAVVFDASFAGAVERLRGRMPGVRAWIEVGDDGTSVPGITSYEAAVAAAAPMAPGSGSPDSLVLIYTGGTTGRPKGVMWRQADLLSLLNSVAARPFAERADPEALEASARTRRPGVRALVACPLMHGFGLYFSLSELISGNTVVTLPTIRYDPEQLLDTVDSLGIKGLALVGDAFARPLLEKLDQHPGRWDVSRLRVLMSSGAMWSSATKQRLLQHMPKARLIDGLGSSEASGIGAAQSIAGEVGETATFEPTDRAAVLLDDGAFAEPGDGRVGKLAVTGWLPVGYLNDPVKTAEVFIEAGGMRWSVPGDLARLEPDGRIRLLGRGSSCINTGGEKVFPEEVEEVLMRHPAVRDTAVVGVQDERFGQTIVALIEPASVPAGSAELEVHVRKRLAGYKVPRLFAFVESVERLPNGKLDHRKNAEIARQQWSTRQDGRDGRAQAAGGTDDQSRAAVTQA